MEAACGQQVYYNQIGDNYGNIQGMLQVAASQTDYNAAACKIWMCKGYKYADNTADVQKYTAGQVVPFTFDIRAPHTGVANVSIVRTSDNTAIGSPLISWDVFASNSVSIPTTETNFSITVPSDLGTQCSTPGACIIQHYWNAASINQTYESCVDFTVAGTSNNAIVDTSASSSAAKSTIHVSSTVTVPAATTQAPVTSSPACLAKRDQTICETIETRTVVETHTQTQSASITQSNVTVSYVTVTETSTVTETTTVPASLATAAAASTSGSLNATSTSCTTKITLSRTGTGAPYPTGNGTLAGAIGSGSAPYPYATGTGVSAVVSPVASTGLAPYPTGNGTLAGAVGSGSAPYPYPTGTAVSAAAISAASTGVAPYPSGNGTLAGAIGSGSAPYPYPTGTGVSAVASPVASTGLAPYPYKAHGTTSAVVAPIVTGNPLAPIANLTSALPTGALTSIIPTALPTALATGYGSANITTPTKPLPSGMSLSDLLEWIAYLLGKASEEAQEESTTKREVGKRMIKRAQAFRG